MNNESFRSSRVAESPPKKITKQGTKEFKKEITKKEEESIEFNDIIIQESGPGITMSPNVPMRPPKDVD